MLDEKKRKKEQEATEKEEQKKECERKKLEKEELAKKKKEEQLQKKRMRGEVLMKKVEATTNTAAKKKRNTRSVSAKGCARSSSASVDAQLAPTQPSPSSTPCPSTPTTSHVGEQDSQSDEDVCEYSFCYGEYFEDGNEWLQCACGRWVHEQCLEDVTLDDQGQERFCHSVLTDLYHSCGKSHILSCTCKYYCILCHLLRMHSFTYIIYSRLCFVNTLRDWTVIVNSDSY